MLVSSPGCVELRSLSDYASISSAKNDRGLRERGRPSAPGLGMPHRLQIALLAYTPLTWFLHELFGHCQSPGLQVDDTKMPVEGFGVLQIGQTILLA